MTTDHHGYHHGYPSDWVGAAAGPADAVAACPAEPEVPAGAPPLDWSGELRYRVPRREATVSLALIFGPPAAGFAVHQATGSFLAMVAVALILGAVALAVDYRRDPAPPPGLEAVDPAAGLEVWGWTCRPCALASGPVASPAEAGTLAAVHDLVYHGRAGTALIARHTPAGGPVDPVRDSSSRGAA